MKRSDWPFAAFIVGGVLLVLLVVAYGTIQYDSFKRQCADRGGHIYDPGTAYCVTDDGRFVEVYP